MTQIDTKKAPPAAGASECAPAQEARELVVNGQRMTVAAQDLAELLRALGYGETRVATALNGEFVPASARPLQPLAPGDHIEIVSPRQGG